MKYILFIVIIIFFFASCNKENRKGCWQGWNIIGYDQNGVLLCDKTKADAEAQFPGLWFYRQGEAKFCWQSVNGTNTNYWVNMPESIKERYVAIGAGVFSKIDCGSFCRCNWLEKHQSKITGLFAPIRRVTETFFSADTCSRLTVGRVIIFRETTDSLITRELESKTP